LFEVPCYTIPATLNGTEGTFGITKSEYKDKMRCGWTIQVETAKVSNATSDIMAFPLNNSQENAMVSRNGLNKMLWIFPQRVGQYFKAFHVFIYVSKINNFLCNTYNHI